MSLRSHLPRIVIAAGAAASIATTQLWWTVEQTASLDPSVLDEQNPTRLYAIQATAETGKRTPASPDGEVDISIDLSAREGTGVQSINVEVELSSPTDGGIQTLSLTVPPGGHATGTVSVNVWEGCMPPSCTENLTLTLRRQQAVGSPTIDVTGSVYAQFRGAESRDPPPGAGIVLDITNVGPVP